MNDINRNTQFLIRYGKPSARDQEEQQINLYETRLTNKVLRYNIIKGSKFN